MASATRRHSAAAATAAASRWPPPAPGGAAAALLLLSALLAAALLPAAAALADGSGAATAPSPEPPRSFGMIVVLRNAAALGRLRVMCTSSTAAYRLFAPALRLPPACHMPGICQRIYSKAVIGRG